MSVRDYMMMKEPSGVLSPSVQRERDAWIRSKMNALQQAHSVLCWQKQQEIEQQGTTRTQLLFLDGAYGN